LQQSQATDYQKRARCGYPLPSKPTRRDGSVRSNCGCPLIQIKADVLQQLHSLQALTTFQNVDLEFILAGLVELPVEVLLSEFVPVNFRAIHGSP
jgi:hypothetical protein